MAILLGSAGYLATLVLPKKYTSSTLVVVERPTVPTKLVKPVVTDDLNHRLASMQEQVLSRSRLQPIIEQIHLYPDLRARVHVEDLVEQLRKAVEVELVQPMPGSVNRQPPSFRIRVTFSDPQLAQQICTQITSMFMEQNVKGREQQAVETMQILSEQLAEAKAKLDEQDRRLAEFKSKNPGILPEQEHTNQSLLAGMNTDLESITQSLGRARQDKSLDETTLSQQEATWKSQLIAARHRDTLNQQMAALQDELAVLLAKYTSQHPDVVKLKAQIEDLKRRVAEDSSAKNFNGASPSPRHEPPAIQQLRAKIKQDDLSIADLTTRQRQIQDQIHVLQARAQSSLAVEQQFKELTRNYQAASETYNELLKKRENFARATDPEHQQESETFKVLGPPSLPLSPSFPQKIVFVGGGLGAGLALALVVLLLLAMGDKAMYSEQDVELCLKLPVLTTVPDFDVAGQAI
jgi:polysaccharide chain length determinant protein (PEP-CTERM system associated)